LDDRERPVAKFIPFLGSKKMPTTPAREIPNVDFRLIPTELHGSWVVLRMGKTQEILGSGATARQALASCDPSPEDVLTEVPVLDVVTYINMPDDA
jgi:hypothetical protein